MYQAVALLMTLAAAEPAECVAQPGVVGNLIVRVPYGMVVEIDGQVMTHKETYLPREIADCTRVRFLDGSKKNVVHEQRVRFVDGAQSVHFDLDRLGRDIPPLAALMPRAEHCFLPQWSRLARSRIKPDRMPSELCPAGVAELGWQVGRAAALAGRPDACVQQLRRVLALVPTYEPAKEIDPKLSACIGSAREGFDAPAALKVTVNDFRQDDGDLVVRLDVQDALDLRPGFAIYAEAAGPRYDDSVGEQQFRRRVRRTPVRLKVEGLRCTEANRSFRDCSKRGNTAIRFPDVKGPFPYEYRLVLLDRNGDHLLQKKLPAPTR